MRFNKDQIKSILLIFYKTNPSVSIKKGSMLKYSEAKFNEHLENMASCQRRALYEVPTEEEAYSLVSPIYEKYIQHKNTLRHQYILRHLLSQ